MNVDQNNVHCIHVFYLLHYDPQQPFYKVQFYLLQQMNYFQMPIWIREKRKRIFLLT